MPRHHHVQDHEVGALVLEDVQGLVAAGGGHHLEARIAQRVFDDRADGLLVVNHQDPLAHRPPLARRRGLYEVARPEPFPRRSATGCSRGGAQGLTAR